MHTHVVGSFRFMAFNMNRFQFPLGDGIHNKNVRAILTLAQLHTSIANVFLFPCGYDSNDDISFTRNSACLQCSQNYIHHTTPL